MKELIEMQSFNRSQVDQSRLFSLDYETVSEPAVPLIHQESRFLFALDGAGKIVIQGKEYDFRRGTLVSILPWHVCPGETLCLFSTNCQRTQWLLLAIPGEFS